MKNKTERFIAIPYHVFDSDIYCKRLTPIARDILHLAIKQLYPREPDREFTLTYSEIRKKYGFSYHNIKIALDLLIEQGLLIVKSKVNKHATRYKLNTKYLEIWQKT
jgi:hypothetical protein